MEFLERDRVRDKLSLETVRSLRKHSGSQLKLEIDIIAEPAYKDSEINKKKVDNRSARFLIHQYCRRKFVIAQLFVEL